MDHGWGPTVEVYLSAEDHAGHAADLHDVMSQELPREVLCVPTHFDFPSDETGIPTPGNPAPSNIASSAST